MAARACTAPRLCFANQEAEQFAEGLHGQRDRIEGQPLDYHGRRQLLFRAIYALGVGEYVRIERHSYGS